MMGVAGVLQGVDAILLDFDGPVCSVFAGYPAPQVADDLREFLTAKGNAGAALSEVADPLQILQLVAVDYPGMAPAVDDMLRTAERTAVKSASPTAYAHDAIIAARRAGRVVAIVSNNSEQAVNDYLARHRLMPHVAFVAGRAHGAPELMKPHPDSVKRAVSHLAVPTGACAFVGDSVTDIEVSHVTGVRSIGYAKTPARRDALVAAGANVVIDTMRDLVTALDAA